jgi:hypothetical protein
VGTSLDDERPLSSSSGASAPLTFDFTTLEANAEIFRDLPNGQLMIVPANNQGTFNK